MQGLLKKVVPAGEAEAWLDEQTKFVLDKVAVSEAEPPHFESEIFEESDDEELPEGHVLVVLRFLD